MPAARVLCVAARAQEHPLLPAPSHSDIRDGPLPDDQDSARCSMPREPGARRPVQASSRRSGAARRRLRHSAPSPAPGYPRAPLPPSVLRLRQMKKLSCVLAVLVIATLSAAAPSIPAQGTSALSKFLTDATGRGDVPGVVVTVVNRDGVLYHDAFGKSSTLRNAPMAKDTIFNIASMTKAVTSVAIMMLVDEGKLKLDDDVAKYLPKYKDPVVVSKFNEADGSYETRPAKRPITIRHLLTHTSGIGYGFSSRTAAVLTQKTGKTELDIPLLFDPGDSWAYGASTRVLGHVVETISGRKIDAFLESRILKPLGMLDTSYLVPTAKYPRVVAVNTRSADGRFVEQPRGATIPAQVQGDGGLYS